MQEGLWFLWFVSAVVSVVAWIYLEIARGESRKFQTRRPLTGCELARQILDRHHLNRTSVTPVSLRGRSERDLLADQLVLEEGIYYGNRLTDLAQALRETLRHLETSQSLIPNSLRRAGRSVLAWGVLVSWCLILGGLIWGRSKGLISLGQFLFVSAFFFALSCLGKEWEVAERAISEMAIEELGTDERIRMKRLLQAMRWTPLADLFRIPFSVLKTRSLKRWPVKT